MAKDVRSRPPSTAAKERDADAHRRRQAEALRANLKKRRRQSAQRNEAPSIAGTPDKEPGTA